jgi:predicted nucleotidyltransferase component of viral defense system
MPANAYQAQVQLLVRALPFVAVETCFALKGGTAINLFVRNLPRLSVDIDLAYLPVADRAASLAAIEAALLRIKAGIEAGIPNATVSTSRTAGENSIVKLVVAIPGAQIKIEVTPVLRGSVYPAAVQQVCEDVEDAFGFAEITVLDFADLYAGKLVAALDRQHPRDLFDARDLLRLEGIDDKLRRAFLVYLISHRRPVAEILACRRKPLQPEFDANFAGMTDEAVTVADLEAARIELVDQLVRQMPDTHRRLLLSVETGTPNWPLLRIAGAADLPAVKWRLQNISGLTDAQRADNTAKLKDVFDKTDENQD